MALDQVVIDSILEKPEIKLLDLNNASHDVVTVLGLIVLSE